MQLAATPIPQSSDGLPPWEAIANRLNVWSRKSDLNRRPADYESAALPTELLRPAPLIVSLSGRR